MLSEARRFARWLGAKRRRWLLAVYVGLVLASHVGEWIAPNLVPGAIAHLAALIIIPEEREPFPEPDDEFTLQLPPMRARGPASGDAVRVTGLEWTPPEGAPPRGAPVLYLHGSPGGASNFVLLGPALAEAGYPGYAIDLPGFGEADRFAPDYSIRAHARYALAAMDELGLERAHVVGFSMGGGVGLHMIDIAPERVASLTMMASIGVQEAEGSGDYHVEHVKYGFGFAALVALPEALPHFGVLGSFGARWAFVRNFWDTDQRPLRAIMERLETPTLILHGRSDPLVPAWGAEVHHQLIQPSRLVMLDASHFLPFRRVGDTVAHVQPFLARHDQPGAPAMRYAADFAPVADGRSGDLGPFHVVRTTPWWLVIIFIILATLISEDATVIAVGILVAGGFIDWGVGLIGCFLGIAIGDGGLWAIGRFIGRPALRWPLLRAWLPEKSLDRWGRWFDRHTVQAVFISRAIPGLRLPTYLAAGLLSKRTHGFLFWAALAAFLWTPLLLTLSIIIGPPLLRFFEGVLGGPLAIVVSVIVLLIGVRMASYMFTWTGRRRLVRDAALLRRPEFWPPWIFYVPLGPWLGWLSVRYGGPMTFTCANPGVPHGGGVVGESKQQILEGLTPHAREWIVRTHLIQEGPGAQERAAIVDSLVENDPALGGYPVILKPDESQRGHGLKVVRSREEAHDYFRDMTRAALLQEFHPGPCEAGILWARRIDNGSLAPEGEIFSITRKSFPVIEGDGVRTLEELIWTHPRFRMQADTFLKRFSDQTDRVLAAGETMRLAVAGNHCQGTMFTDGADLATANLEARLNEIAAAFDEAAAGMEERHDPPGFDFGRFDIRYESDEQLRRGEGFKIIELNGTMSESTNLYDPGKPLWWSYGVLFRQWARLYRLGAQRRRAGVRPMRIGELTRAVRDHYRGRPGSAVSD